MQCEGITRAGKRCRNKALDDEIFCEIHLRVNRTYNLALLIPFATALLFAYFFLFGLYFDTLHYGIFDLQYLKYAGLDDFFIGMLRNGGMLTAVVLKAWAFYTFLVAAVFTIWLLARLIHVTSGKHLKLATRLKMIGLSLGIFTLNVLHMFIFMIPQRNRKYPAQIMIGREHLALSLNRHRRTLADKDGPDPAEIAGTLYRRFLAVSTFRNHRFAVTILLLTLASTASILYAGYEARKMRQCIIMASDGRIVPAEKDAATLYPALNMSSLCRSHLDTPAEDISVSSKFRRTLVNFFNFPVVMLKQGQAAKPVLYLGATSRFELFFNGATRLPFAVPVQHLGPLYDPPPMRDDSRIAGIETRMGAIEALAQENSRTLLESLRLGQENSNLLKSLADAAKQPLTPDLGAVNHKLARLEQNAAETAAAIDGLQEGMGRIGHALGEIEQTTTARIGASVPEDCWEIDPHLIVTFNVGSTRVSGAETQALIARLAEHFKKREKHFIVISGHSDPSGSTFENYRLSRQRAHEVTNLMLEAGLAKEALFVIGRGEDDSPDLPQRRVEIRDCSAPVRED
jgi:outer membrane protein OmpA-like peptidoglycan-associated protein